MSNIIIRTRKTKRHTFEIASYLMFQIPPVVKMELTEKEARKVTVDFQYFIQMALEKKMAWSTLAHLLTDLAASPEKSKQVIKMLLQELEIWISRVENESNKDIDVMGIPIIDEKQLLERSLQNNETFDNEMEVLDLEESEVIERHDEGSSSAQ